MALTKLRRLTRLLIPVLIASLLVSCSASQHARVTTINEPPLAEDNETSWSLYYQYQFDANEGKVMPPSVQYPLSAVRAYQREKVNWDNKVQEAKQKNLIAYIGAGMAGVVGVILIYLIFKSSPKLSLPGVPG